MTNKSEVIIIEKLRSFSREGKYIIVREVTSGNYLFMGVDISGHRHIHNLFGMASYGEGEERICENYPLHDRIELLETLRKFNGRRIEKPLGGGRYDFEGQRITLSGESCDYGKPDREVLLSFVNPIREYLKVDGIEEVVIK